MGWEEKPCNPSLTITAAWRMVASMLSKKVMGAGDKNRPNPTAVSQLHEPYQKWLTVTLCLRTTGGNYIDHLASIGKDKEIR